MPYTPEPGLIDIFLPYVDCTLDNLHFLVQGQQFEICSGDFYIFGESAAGLLICLPVSSGY